MENNNLAPILSKIAKTLAKVFGLYTLIQIVFMLFMPPALWPFLFLELIGPIASTSLAYVWHKNMEEEIKEQRKREILKEMEDEECEVLIEFDEEDDAEFYFQNEEAMQELIEKVIAAAKLKAEQEGIEFIDAEEGIESEKDSVDVERTNVDDAEEKKVEHLGLVDDDDYTDYEQPREFIDDDDYEDDNSSDLGI